VRRGHDRHGRLPEGRASRRTGFRLLFFGERDSGPHPAPGSAAAAAIRGARSRFQRRLRQVTPRRVAGIRARNTTGRLCWVGGGGLAQSRPSSSLVANLERSPRFTATPGSGSAFGRGACPSVACATASIALPSDLIATGAATMATATTPAATGDSRGTPNRIRTGDLLRESSKRRSAYADRIGVSSLSVCGGARGEGG